MLIEAIGQDLRDAACRVPALRAPRVDPVDALRSE